MLLLGNLPFSSPEAGQPRAAEGLGRGLRTWGDADLCPPPEATVRSTTMSQHGRSQARVGLGLAASPSLRVLARAMSGARGCKDLTFWAQALRVSEEMLTATPAFTFRSLSMGPSQHQKRGLLVLPSPLPAGDLGGQGAPGPGPHLGQWGYMGGGGCRVGAGLPAQDGAGLPRSGQPVVHSTLPWASRGPGSPFWKCSGFGL